MSLADREKWNRRHEGGTPGEPSALVTSLGTLLPASGRALDVAGGTGRHAAWLAARGLAVTLVDVSDTAVALAAKHPGVTALLRDLEVDPLPEGPWELILVVHFLQRSLFPQLIEGLAPGGTLVYLQPTTTNLERHEKPPADFCVAPGELRAAFEGALEIVDYEEKWWDEERHEARLVARRR